MHLPIFVMTDSFQNDNHMIDCASEVPKVEMLNWTAASIIQISVNDGHKSYDRL